MKIKVLLFIFYKIRLETQINAMQESEVIFFGLLMCFFSCAIYYKALFSSEHCVIWDDEFPVES